MNTLIILTYILALSFVILVIEYNKLKKVNKVLIKQLEGSQSQRKSTLKPIHKNIKSDLYPYDEKYDKLIKKIVTENEVCGISEHNIEFKVGKDVFLIWIANRDCAYGAHLKKRDNLSYEIRERGISRSTIEKLYEKEMSFREKNPMPSRKEIEDGIILELLGGDDEKY